MQLTRPEARTEGVTCVCVRAWQDGWVGTGWLDGEGGGWMDEDAMTYTTHMFVTHVYTSQRVANVMQFLSIN